MPDGTETRIANIPGHGQITVNNVPTGMSDDDFRNQFRQRHPEYFKSTQVAPQTAGPQTAQPGVSPDTSSGIAGRLRQALSPENIASHSEPPTGAPWYSPEHIAAGGVRNMIAPAVGAMAGPSSPEESAAYATGGQGAVAGKRAAGASIEGVKRALAMPSIPSATGGNTNLILAGLNAIPVLGPYISGIIERSPRDPLGALTDITSGLALHGMTSGEMNTPKAKADIGFEGQVRANRIVEGRRADISRAVRDAEQGVKDHVGQLVRGIEGEDVRQAGSTPKPTISGAHLNDAISEVEQAFGIDQTNNPAFKQAVNKITNQGGQGYWSDYHNLKMGLRDLWSKAPEGSRQRAALDALSKPVEEMLKDRAQEIGQGEQYDTYNQLWSKLKTFDNSGSLSDLLSLKPHDNMGFLKMINDPSHISQLRPVAKALSEYGLDPSIFDSQRSQLDGVYKAMQSGKGKALIGAVNAIQREPVAGTIGALAGHTLLNPIGHGFIGAILGASKAVRMAETARLASEVKKMGVPPETQIFKPGISKVKAAEPLSKTPTAGGGTAPPSPTDPISSAASRGIDIDALKGTLANLGVKGQASITSRLKDILARNPKTTEEAAEMLAGKKTDVNAVADKIRAAMDKNKFPGTSMTFYSMRQIDPSLADVPKETFDQAALSLQKQGKADLLVHDSAARLPKAKQDEFVTDGKGNYYVSMVSRKSSDIHQDLLRTALELGGGKISERILLRDLRPRMEKLGYDRASVDKAIKTLQVDPHNALSAIPIDLPSDITEADRKAAIDIAGKERHAVILRKKPAEK